MAKKPKSKTESIPKAKKKVFRFYGFYNNISIGPKIHLNNVKIILHEQPALTIEEAVQLYKLYLIHKVGISETDVQQYLIDLYFKSMKVEILDGDSVTFEEIPLI